MSMSPAEDALRKQVSSLQDALCKALRQQGTDASAQLFRSLQADLQAREQSQAKVHTELEARTAELECARAELRELSSHSEVCELPPERAKRKFHKKYGASCGSEHLRDRLLNMKLGQDEIQQQQGVAIVNLWEVGRLSGLNVHLAADIVDLRQQLATHRNLSRRRTRAKVHPASLHNLIEPAAVEGEYYTEYRDLYLSPQGNSVAPHLEEPAKQNLTSLFDAAHEEDVVIVSSCRFNESTESSAFHASDWQSEIESSIEVSLPSVDVQRTLAEHRSTHLAEQLELEAHAASAERVLLRSEGHSLLVESEQLADDDSGELQDRDVHLESLAERRRTIAMRDRRLSLALCEIEEALISQGYSGSHIQTPCMAPITSHASSTHRITRRVSFSTADNGI